MITANVIHRVFGIRCGDMTGTAFTVDVHRAEFLVTAAHVVAGHEEHGLALRQGDGWRSMDAQLVGQDTDLDIAVFSVEERLTPEGLPLTPTSDGIVYGQDVFFLGFPYGFLGKYVLTDQANPLPHVKKAILSLMDEGRLYLDGHNNPGFSGGPVVFKAPGQRDFRVAAVVSSYRAVAEPIHVGDEQTDLHYWQNTGIVVAYDINHALKLIDGGHGKKPG